MAGNATNRHRSRQASAWIAMAKKDIAALNELISNELVYTHSTARLDTKQSLIGNMEFGRDRLHLGRAVRRQGAGSGRHGRADRLVQHQRHVARPPNSFGVRFTDV